MAPHFLGEHFEVQCQDCGSKFVADLSQSKSRKSLICPFCGGEVAVSDCKQQASDLVDIELDAQSISRWDVVAFHVPGAQEAAIKRVVGLPGESLDMIRKPIEAQKRTRIQIHDSDKTNPQQKVWRAVDSSGLSLGSAQHRFDDGKFVFDREANDSQIQWFEFCNRRNYSHRSRKDSPKEAGEKIGENANRPIEDNYGYNQSLSRRLNVVEEVYISLRLVQVGLQKVGWKFPHQADNYVCSIDFEKRELMLDRLGKENEDPLRRIALSDELFQSPDIEVELSTIDDTVMVLVGGVEVIQFLLETSTTERVSIDSASEVGGSFQIGAALDSGFGNGAASVSPLVRVQVWRDIYYLPGEQVKKQSQTLDGSSEGYLLLGDNQPVSIDSRHWPEVSVSSDQLIGKVRD